MQTIKLPEGAGAANEFNNLVAYMLRAQIGATVGSTVNIITRVGDKYVINTESELAKALLKFLAKIIKSADGKTPAQILLMFNRDNIPTTIGELTKDLIHIFCPHTGGETVESMMGNLNVKFLFVLTTALYSMFTTTMAKIDITHMDTDSAGFLCFINIILFISQIAPLLLLLMKIKDETSLLHSVQIILSETTIDSQLTMIAPVVSGILTSMKKDSSSMHGGGFSLCNVIKSIDVTKINAAYTMSLFKTITDVSGAEPSAKYIRAVYYIYIMYLKNIDSIISKLNTGNVMLVSPLTIKNMLNTALGVPPTVIELPEPAPSTHSG
jgi:hypothetical protein